VSGAKLKTKTMTTRNDSMDDGIMILPTIHTNGTSAEDLRDGYLDACRAVCVAMDAMRTIEFNARDYYPQGQDAWRQAEAEQRARYDALQTIANELHSVVEHCQNAIDEKEARRKERAA